MKNKNEQKISWTIWKFRKIKTWRKWNYINEDKTEQIHKKKHYNTELEKIYSEDIDKRYQWLIKNWYDYMINLLKYEFDNKSNIVFLEEKIWQSIYFILLNYIIIHKEINKSKFLHNFQNKKCVRKNIYKIMELLNIDIKTIKLINLNFFVDIKISELSDENYQLLKKLLIDELNNIKVSLTFEQLITIKGRKNKVTQEISNIIFNTYDFLFLLYYIINFFKELSFILADGEIEEITNKMEKYNILIKEEEFATIIEIIVMFFLKWYKNYLYKNYNFLGAINELVLKTKKALEYKKWSPIKSNFKSWLSNWSKNYIKLYIQEEVRPLEQMENMNYIYNHLSKIIVSNNPKDMGDIKDITDKDNKTRKDKDNIIDIKDIEGYKRQIMNNNDNNNLMKNYDEIATYNEKLEKILKIKKNISNDNIVLEKKLIENINKKDVINTIRKYIYDIQDYLYKLNGWIETWNTILMEDILQDIERYNKQELFWFLIKIIEIIINKNIDDYQNINNLIVI